MDFDDAIDLLRPHVRPSDRAWADVGAGDGLFTRALARLLAPSAVVYAIDRDAHALRALKSLAASLPRDRNAEIVPRREDLDKPLDLPPIDGALLANVLHFVPLASQAEKLGEIASFLEPGGRLVVIEYDNRPASRWVPFPVSRRRLIDIASEAGLAEPVVSATRPSAYGGVLYAAIVSLAQA